MSEGRERDGKRVMRLVESLIMTLCCALLGVVLLAGLRGGSPASWRPNAEPCGYMISGSRAAFVPRDRGEGILDRSRRPYGIEIGPL